MRTLKALAVALPLVLVAGLSATAAASVASQNATLAATAGLSAAQKADLLEIARDTWNFYTADLDPATGLPMDNLTYAGGSTTPTGFGRYTSASNVGVYLWAVVAAADLKLIGRVEERDRVRNLLTTVGTLRRDHGFLLQWYDTSNGQVLRNPGDTDCPADAAPSFDNCSFVSQVDNGWYASGLIVARDALPELRGLINSMLAPMDFGLFYDGRPQTHCNVNPDVIGNQPTGQMFGGYYVGLPPDQGDNWQHYYHNGAFYSDPRISAYIGMGLHQMPGDVWWRTWRTLPPKAPYADCQVTDPDFSWQGQWPVAGYWQKYTDPQSGKVFDVWEGHYVYPGSDLTYIPTWAGGMFEALMAAQVVPETKWGPHSFGLADVRTAQLQIKYETEQLHQPVWGMSPSSTPDDSGGYGGYGVEGLTFPYFGGGADANNPNKALSQCYACASETVVTPHASFLALDVVPQQAYANIVTLRQLYPDIYGAGGFFDAVNPTTGAVGHRYLVLDQSMIMASLDNALNNGGLQSHFADDSVSWAAKTYLSMETMSLS